MTAFILPLLADSLVDVASLAKLVWAFRRRA